jgi:hypothetical protein
VVHRYFDRVIVVAILANSVILGLSDFSVVDNNLNPASSGVTFRNGAVVPGTSLANKIVELSEVPFTAVFATECAIKIVAMGFAGRKGSYLRDSWNMLDFVVVISRYEPAAALCSIFTSLNRACRRIHLAWWLFCRQCPMCRQSE